MGMDTTISFYTLTINNQSFGVEMELSELSKWLEITEQQLIILGITNKLRSSSKLASPKNIALEFKRHQGKTIQKSNLFAQMKVLMERGFIKKTGKADYLVVPETLRSDLLKKKNMLLEEASQIDELAESLDNFFLDISQEKAEQSIEYLDHKALFDTLEKKFRYAKEIYVASKFPSTSFTYPTYSMLKRGKYIKTLRDRCFDAKGLRLTFLTHLGIEHPFDHAMSFYKNDAKAAYRECEIIIRQLENHVKSYDNYVVKYSEHPFGFDVLIPVLEEINEFFMFVRDEKDRIVGGIHIRSSKTAKKAYERFLRECESATRVRGGFAEKITEKLLHDLKSVYEQYKDIAPSNQRKVNIVLEP